MRLRSEEVAMKQSELTTGDGDAMDAKKIYFDEIISLKLK